MSTKGERKREREAMRIKAPSSQSVRFVGPRMRKKRRRPRLKTKAFLREQALRMRNRPTAAENIIAGKLKELGIDFEQQYVVFYKGIAAIYDFYLPKMRLLFEVDGGYHQTEAQKQTDRIKDFIAKTKLKRNMLRITNERAFEISNNDLRQLIYAVKGKRQRAWAS